MVDFQLRKGRTLTLGIGVVNIGDQEGTQTIKLKRGGSVIDSQDVTLGAANESTTQLSFDSAGLATGDYTLTAASADDSDSTTVTVAAEADSQFDVTITDTTSPVVEGERVFVSADITNSGDELDAQPISLSIDNGIGTVATSRNLPVASGETKSISLDWDTSEGDKGDYTATVASDDDSTTASIDVNLDPDDTTGVTEQWSISYGGSFDINPISVSDSQIFVTGSSDDLTAYALSDASQNWSVTSDVIEFSEYSGGLFTVNDEPTDGVKSVSKRDTSSGSADWGADNSGIRSIGAGGYCAVGFNGGGVKVLSIDNGIERTSFGTDNQSVIDVVVSGNEIYSRTIDRLKRTNIKKSTDQNGNTTYSTNTVWTNKTGISNNVDGEDISDTSIYIGDDSVISQYDRDTGTRTKIKAIQNQDLLGIAYLNGAIYAHVDPDELWSISLDGTVNWKETTDGTKATSIAAVNDSIFLSGPSAIYKYDLDT